MATTVKTTKVSQKFDLADDVGDLVEEIRSKADSLETLILEGNSYGIEAARVLGEELSMCPNLKHLYMNDMFISRLKTEIPEALRLMFGGVMASGAKIITLNLNDNAIGPVTMPELLPFLQSPSCASLQVLRLNNCGLGTRGGNMLSTVLFHLENLNELIIGRNRLEIDGIRDISQALLKLNKLEVLELPQNGTKGEGIVALVRALEVNPNLRILNLNDNVLKNMDKLLSDAIRHLNHLEVLNFGDCLLKTNGCISILSAVQHLCNTNGACNLREIILNGNEIGKAATETIVATIELILANRPVNADTRLKVDLSCNNLGEDIVEQLRNQFSDLVDLIVEDDEGSADEHEDGDTTGAGEDEEEEDGQRTPELNGAAGDNGEAPDVAGLVSKFESKYVNLQSLASELFRCSSKGMNPSTNTLSPLALAEIEAIVKVGLAHQAAGHDFQFINDLMVACGLLKSEDKSLMPAKGQDISGALLGLGASLKHWQSSEQKRCVKNFLQKAIDDPKYEKIKVNLYSFIYSF